MKLKKQELKALVKQCLIEILSEGLGSTEFEKPEKKNESLVRKQVPVRKPQVASQTPMLKEAIKELAGKDQVMSEIFADTALSTLHEQSAAESRSYRPVDGASREARIVAAATPEELFGEETTSNWANLAFADVTNKKLA